MKRETKYLGVLCFVFVFIENSRYKILDLNVCIWCLLDKQIPRLHGERWDRYSGEERI